MKIQIVIICCIVKHFFLLLGTTSFYLEVSLFAPSFNGTQEKLLFSFVCPEKFVIKKFVVDEHEWRDRLVNKLQWHVTKLVESKLWRNKKGDKIPNNSFLMNLTRFLPFVNFLMFTSAIKKFSKFFRKSLHSIKPDILRVWIYSNVKTFIGPSWECPVWCHIKQ